MRSTWTRLLAALTIVAVLGVPTIGRSQNSPYPLTQTATLQNAAVATGNGTIFNVSQFAAITVQTTIVTTATVVYESSNDNVNFVSQTCFTLDGQTSSTSTTVSAMVRCDVNGLNVFRARISSWGSGAVTVTVVGTSNAMAVRDQVALSGAITGQLRGTQTTAPTCGYANGAGVMVAGNCTVFGTDSFFTLQIGGAAQALAPNSPTNVVVTFNTAYTGNVVNGVATNPNCLARYNATYGYYIYAVTQSATTVTLALGFPSNVLTPAKALFGPFDSATVICAGGI